MMAPGRPPAGRGRWIQSECEKSIDLSGGIASVMPGPDAGDASRRRHVDIRQFPVEDGGGQIRFHALASMAYHVRLASLRIAGGCSASFISPQGLVMTNHHCVVDCVEQLSTPQQNLVESGFAAKTVAEERKCPAFELDQLVQIRDVTGEVRGAIAGKTGDDANKALHAKQAELQQSCGSDPSVRCDVVSLYHGGIYDLYRYKRYTDVRLVFAPEF